MMKAKAKQQSGFAVIPEDLRREIARKGGLAVSTNRFHMVVIGRKGGIVSGQKRRERAKLASKLPVFE